MSFPPGKIKIISDGNELELHETSTPKGKGEVQYIYKYIVSKSKKGTLLGLNENELIKLIGLNKAIVT